METVTVNANALRQILEALSGPPHHMRELLVISDLPGHDCPIKRLVNEYNDAVEKYNEGLKQRG